MPGADSKNASPVRKRKEAVPDATVALTDYYPTTNERKVYRKKMETWMRRITRETETIDEEEFVLRMLSQDGELGYMCTQTVRYMVRLHNCMLAKKTSEHSKSVSRRKSSKPKGEKVEDSSFPPRAAVKSESRSKGVRRSAAARHGDSCRYDGIHAGYNRGAGEAGSRRVGHPGEFRSEEE